VTLEIVARRDDFSSKEHRTPNIERRTSNAEPLETGAKTTAFGQLATCKPPRAN
jgi:hypothetical protein